MSQHLHVPHGPVVGGRLYGVDVFALRLPPGPLPLRRDQATATRWLLQHGSCPACAQPLDPRRLDADLARCLDGHIVSLTAARRLVQERR